MRIQLVIPARYNSGRLPGKPLIDLNGMPMVERTWRQCIAAMPAEQVIVATDDARIEEVCRAKGIAVIMTSSSCLTGTDRVAEVASRVPADYYINVQGDEPLVDPQDIRDLAAAAENNPQDLLLGFCEIDNEELYRNPTVPKAVFRKDGRLLYVSRAAIPATKTLEFRRAWRPVWIYGFPPDALRAFTAEGGKTPIEDIEDNEITRFLEIGYEVRLVPMTAHSIAVDTEADVGRVLYRLRGP